MLLCQVYCLYISSLVPCFSARCIDQLWISDSKNTSGFVCSDQSRRLLFESSSNWLVVRFKSSPQIYQNSKGFWLYYQGKQSIDIPEI